MIDITDSEHQPDDAELLGAYALDALSDSERGRVEDLLERSAPARAELARLRHAAAALSSDAAASAPEGSWARVAGALAGHDPSTEHRREEVGGTGPPPPDLGPAPVHRSRSEDVVGGVTEAESVPLAPTMPERRSAPTVWPRLLVAALVIALTLLGAMVVRQGGRIDRLTAELARGGPQAAAESLVADPDTTLVTLKGAGGRASVRAAVGADGAGYLFGDDLPALPAGRTYQLWAAGSHSTVSVGVLGQRPNLAAFHTGPDTLALALTVEDAGGVVTSDRKPVAVGELAR